MQYIQPSLCNYYFGRLQREEVEPILRKRGCKNGLFLLRQHLHDLEVYVLSICNEKQIKHYKFEKRKNQFQLGNSPAYASPIELIEYLKKNDNGLITRPSVECNRFSHTEPINYLFISTEDFVYTVEKEIRKRCRSNDDVSVAMSRMRFKYEKIALKSIHFTQQWYRKNINKSAAEELFKENGYKTGMFLLRSNRLMRYKLSLCDQEIVYHYSIVYNDRRYSIEGSIGEEFETLAQLIDFYGRKDGFIKCKLLMPYNSEATYVCDTNEYYRAFIEDNEELLFHLKSTKNQIAYSDLTLKVPSTVFLDKIAEGHNSRIFKAHCVPKNNNNCKIEVAVKILKVKSNELINEYKLVSVLNHANIVRIIEPASDFTDEDIQNSVIIFEYAHLGSFNSYLKENSSLKTTFLINILQQMASALVYLTSKQIVHRDVAARNVLLFSKDLAKLTDFGLSRRIEEDANYYCSVEEQAWPVKWYPPEVFELRRFNEQSDVYSFGVLMWEAFSNGDTPYGAVKTFSYDEVKAFFSKINQKKLKLQKPDKCPDELYKLISSCLNTDYISRPTFIEIDKRLKVAYDSVREKKVFDYTYDLEMSKL